MRPLLAAALLGLSLPAFASQRAATKGAALHATGAFSAPAPVLNLQPGLGTLALPGAATITLPGAPGTASRPGSLTATPLGASTLGTTRSAQAATPAGRAAIAAESARLSESAGESLRGFGEISKGEAGATKGLGEKLQLLLQGRRSRSNGDGVLARGGSFGRLGGAGLAKAS